MIDEILPREVLLRHRPVSVVLIADVSVEIDLCRHDSLAGQVHARRPGRDLELSPTADARELRVFDDECGVFDGGGAVARDEPRSFEYRHTSRRGLALYSRGTGGCH